MKTETDLAGENRRLREALQGLYDETADYISINNLGDVHHNQAMKKAEAALSGEPVPPAQNWISVNELPNNGKGSRQWYWITDGELYDVAILVHGKFTGHRELDAKYWMMPAPVPPFQHALRR